MTETLTDRIAKEIEAAAGTAAFVGVKAMARILAERIVENAGSGGSPSQDTRTVTDDFEVTPQDKSFLIQVTASSPVFATVLPGMEDNASVDVLVIGSSFVQFEPGAGVTLIHPQGFRRSVGPGARVTLRHTGGNQWVLSGDLREPITPPVIPGLIEVTISEDIAIGATVATIQNTGGPVESWVIDNPLLAISAAGVVTVAQDIEYDTAPQIFARITATNVVGSVACDLQVTVTEVIPPPPPVLASRLATISETAALGATIARLENTGGPISTWALVSGAAGAWVIEPDGDIRLVAPLSFATTPTYTMLIRATGPAGAVSEAELTVQVRESTVAPGSVAVTTTTIFGPGNAAGATLAFAHVFADGDMPAGSQVMCRNTLTGDAMPTQFTPTMFYESGAVWHALMAVELPARADNEELPIAIRRGETFGTLPALNLNTLLAGQTATVTITPALGGAPQVFNLLENAATQPRWRDGPLAIEYRREWQLPTALVGTQTMRLVVDVRVLKDGRIWVDLQPRNDAVLITGGSASYSINLTINGQSLAQYSLVHPRYMNFVRQRMSGGAPQPMVMGDPDYLASFGFVPPYDYRLGPSPIFVDRATRVINSGTWDVPFNVRDMNPRMGAGAGRMEIGPMPDAHIAALARNRACYIWAEGLSEAIHGVPWHFWDRTNGRWLNSIDHPTLWAERRGPVWAPFMPVGTPWENNQGAMSHQPEAHTLFWAMTGRRSALDGLIAQACWNVMYRISGSGGRGTFANSGTSPADRLARLEELRDTGNGGNLYQRNQLRGFAWSLRQMMLAWRFAPASEQPFGDYLRRVWLGNMAYVTSRLPTWRSLTGFGQGPDGLGISGVFAEDEGGNTLAGLYATWQHDYTISTVLRSHMLKLPGITPLVQYTRNFTLNRFLRGAQGFNPTDGGRNQLAALPGGVWAQTWAQLGTLNAGQTYGPPPGNWPPSREFGDYARLAMGSSSYWVTAFPDDAEAHRALSVSLIDFDPIGSRIITEIAAQIPNQSHTGWRRTRAPGVRPTVVADTVNVSEASAVGPVFVARVDDGFPTSFQIIDGNSDGKLTIDRSGVVSITSALSIAVETQRTIRIRATNAFGSSEGDIVMNTVSAAPLISPIAAFTVPQNMEPGFVVGRPVSTRGIGITWSFAGGNAGNLYAIDPATGVVTVAASLAGLAGEVRNLVVRATNTFGTDEETLVVTVGTTVIAPTIAPNQRFLFSRNAALNATVGTLTFTGTAPVLTVVRGDPGGEWSLNPSTGLIRKNIAAPMSDPFAPFRVIRIRAENAAGAVEADVQIAFSEAATIFDFTESVVLAVCDFRRVRPSYTGPLIRIAVGTSGGSEFDIGADAAGNLNMAEVAAAVAGGPSWLVTMYDQGELGQHFTETNTALRPQFTDASGVAFSSGDGGNTRALVRVSGSQGISRSLFETGGGSDLAGLAAFEVTSGVGDAYVMSFLQDDATTNAGLNATTGALAIQGTTAPAGGSVQRAGVVSGGSFLALTGTPQAANTFGTQGARFTPTNVTGVLNKQETTGLQALGSFRAQGTARMWHRNRAVTANSLNGRAAGFIWFSQTSIADMAKWHDSTMAYYTGPVVDPVVITPSQNFPTIANAAPGQELGNIAWSGSPPTSFSLTGTGSNLFAVTLGGLLTVEGALSAGTYNLTATASNAAGGDSEAFTVTVAASGVAPTVSGGPDFEISNTAAVDTVVGTMTATGTPPITWSISVGDDAFYRIESGGVLRVESSLLAAPAIKNMTIRAQNVAGNGTRAVTVRIAEATSIYGLSAGTAIIGLYGLRRLRASYTGSLLRIRRASDNDELDVGFDGDGHLNWTAATAFVGSQASFVTRWYDQGPRAQNLIQTVANRQPHFTTATGAMFQRTGTANNRPVIRLPGSASGQIGLRCANFTGPTDKFGAVVGIERSGSVATPGPVFLALNPSATSFSQDARAVLLLDAGGSAVNTTRLIGGTWSLLAHQNTLANNTPAVLAARFPGAGGGAVRNYIDGVWSGNGLSSSDAFASSGELRVGFLSDANTSLIYNGRIWELLLTADVADADVDTVRNNLRDYWGY